MAMDATLLKTSAGSPSHSSEPTRAAHKSAQSGDADGFSRTLANARHPAQPDGQKTSSDKPGQTTKSTCASHGVPQHTATPKAAKGQPQTEADHRSAGKTQGKARRVLAGMDRARAGASAESANKAAGQPAQRAVAMIIDQSTEAHTHGSARAGHDGHKRKHVDADKIDAAAGNPTMAIVAQASLAPRPTDTPASDRSTARSSGRARQALHGHGARIDPRLLAGNSSAANVAGTQNDTAAQTAAAQTAANASAQAPDGSAAAFAMNFLRDGRRAGDSKARASDNLFASSLAQSSHPSAQPSAAPPPATYNIAAPLGSAAWQTSISQHSLRLAANGDGRAELTLHPRDLGQIQVSLKLDASNQTQLHFVSPHAHVREAIEAAMPQLRQAFAAGGLALGQASVGDQSQPRSGGQFSEDSRRRTASIDGTPAVISDTLALNSVPTATVRTPRGSVDTFA
jgi:flagellar hook-length control protein FliK